MTVDELEKAYEKQQKKVVTASKRYNYPIIGKLFYKKLMTEKRILQDIFRLLRDETRKAHPEKFIRSTGDL